MGVIFNEAEAVWEWLMTHLIVINLLFSIIIIFFQVIEDQAAEIPYEGIHHFLRNIA